MDDETQPSPWVQAAAKAQAGTDAPAPEAPPSSPRIGFLREHETLVSVGLGMLLGGGGVLLLGALVTMLS